MVRLSFVSLLAAASIAAAASAVVDLIPANFDSLITAAGAKPALVKFYAPWCGHCKNLAPIYEELAQKFEKSTDVTIAKADCDAHKSIGAKNNIRGFPTLKFFNSVVEEDSANPVAYEGPRDLKSLTQFVEKHSGVSAASASESEPSSPVALLDDSSFHKTVGQDKNVLVAFTAPWCGHCRNLAPAWEKLALAFIHEPTVVIAKVDADSPGSKGVAKEYGVSGYPTIKFFPKHSKQATDYAGGRQLDQLLSKVNELAGTFRKEDGTLSEKAGVIPKAIEVISGAEGDLLELIKSWEAKGSAIEAKAAAYYKTVHRNINRKKNYLEDEIRRLRSILPQPLSPENHDYVKVRLNILESISTAISKAKEAAKQSAEEAAKVAAVVDEFKQETNAEMKEEL